MKIAVHRILALTLLGGVALANDQVALVADQIGHDITVLKSFSTQYRIGAAGTDGAQLSLDLDQCQITGDSSNFTLTLDCTEQAQKLIDTQAQDVMAPLATSVFVSASRNLTGAGYTSSYFCTVQEIQTVTRADALKSAEGIGFSFNGAVRVIPVAELRPIGSARLRNGEAVVVHRFQAPVFCWAGSAT